MVSSFLFGFALLWMSHVQCLLGDVSSVKGSCQQGAFPGPRGLPGPVGQSGQPGLSGPPGPHGPPGLTGIQGREGRPGPVGPQGLPGRTGPKGGKGDRGLQGRMGEDGVRGKAGPKGDDGQKGDNGPVGPKGTKDNQGIKGMVGTKGAKGDEGKKGLPGTIPSTIIDSMKTQLDHLQKSFQLVIANLKQVSYVESGETASSCNATGAGNFFLNSTSKELMVCNGEFWDTISNGKSYRSCSNVPGRRSGTYHLRTIRADYAVGFCDYSLLSQSCQLVWKHSYYQVGTPEERMRTFSSYDRPCRDLSDGWCNVANKDMVPGSTQVTAAYHKGKLVYAYRGDRNSELGKSWRGAILNNPSKILDLCTSGNGVPPEPTSDTYPGLSFDKWNPGKYNGNCDTDVYPSLTDDCRWANCGIPSSISSSSRKVQMTVAIYLC